MTLDELMNDPNWAQVFADDNSGNVSKDTDSADGTDPDPPPTRAAVAEIIALTDTSEQEWDGWSGKGVFRLNDGRYLYAEGSCDYTGWD